MYRAFLLMVLWCFSLVPALGEERIALVMGNSSYEAVDPLDNPSNDARDVTQALEGLGFRVTVLLDATNTQMEEAIANFAIASAKADVTLFYFAGHAVQALEQNYLLPVDARIQSIRDLPSQTVPFTDILSAMRKSKGQKLVFLDACRDNPFGDAAEQLREMSGGLASVGTNVSDGPNVDIKIVFATEPGKVAYDGTGRKNSYFTEAFLNHVNKQGQNISDFMIRVRNDVFNVTGGKQTPWERSSLRKQFVFKKGSVNVPPETQLWQAAMRENDLELVQIYVDQYPLGVHKDEAFEILRSNGQARSMSDGEARSMVVQDPETNAEKLWSLAKEIRLRPVLEYYVEKYPQSANHADAVEMLARTRPVELASPGERCERLATHPNDATGAWGGVPMNNLRLHVNPALQACTIAEFQSPELTHYTTLLARATYASGDCINAIELFERAADRGDPRAIVSLAVMMRSGNCMDVDRAGALKLYEKAAEAGSLDAKTDLAAALLQGTLGPKDQLRAIDLMREAAASGWPAAIHNLGWMAENGLVDTPEAALSYFKRAAVLGHSESYNSAAILLDQAIGAAYDPKAAADMLLRAVVVDNGKTLGQLTDPRLNVAWSSETIAAMQEVLKRAGYYDSVIDGVPGPGFKAALKIWRNGGFDELLLPGG